MAARRSLGPLNLGDPALRRDLAITRRLDALSHRGLRLLHGDHPTPDQAAGYWLAQDLGPVLRRLNGLGDDELRDVLTRLCRRLWMEDRLTGPARRRPIRDLTAMDADRPVPDG